MKLLLDENLPKKLKLDYLDHDIYTVSDQKWNGIENGKLLELLVANNFDALLTFDKNLQHQQNFKKYTITVFVLSAPINSYSVLSKLSEKIKAYLSLKSLPHGPVVIEYTSK